MSSFSRGGVGIGEDALITLSVGAGADDGELRAGNAGCRHEEC